MGAKVAFSFDLTGSQAPVYFELRRALSQTLKQLFPMIPGLEVALIAHGDYCDAGKTYVTKTVDFSNDVNALMKFAQTVTTTDGGDSNECYEYVMNLARGLNWGDADKKVLVMIGDANPHEVGYRYGSKTYYLDWMAEANALTAQNIQIYSVQCQGNRGSMPFWKELGKHGYYLDLAHFGDIVSLFEATCHKQAGDSQLNDYVSQLASTGRLNRNLAGVMGTLLGRLPDKMAFEMFGDTDLKAVDPHRFQVLHVDERTPIKAFVQENGARFKVGRGFYQWTKREEVQEYKEVVLRDKVTGDMFSGDEARRRAGIPIGDRATLRPGAVEGYDVFVQSTSANRVLMPGTLFLYEVL